MNRSGTRSATRLWRASSSAVPGPMAASFTPARSRPSRRASQKRPAPLADVSTTHATSSRSATAARSAAPSSSGSVISMVGTTTGSAPAARSGAASADAWWAGRVTTTRFPKSGRDSNQSRSVAATAPMTMTLGACRSWSAMVASVARTVCCSGRVPQRTAAAGVSGARPPASRRSTIFGRRPTPMRMTMVPPRRATASQSSSPPLSGSSWPVTTVNDVDEWRRVTGMPA